MSQELLGLPVGYRDQGLGLFSIAFPGYTQGVEMEVEQPGLKLVPMWADGSAVRGLACTATVPEFFWVFCMGSRALALEPLPLEPAHTWDAGGG